MREELEQIQKIELLLDGQLSEQERIAFEQQIASDPGLQDDVKLQRAIKTGIERISLVKYIKHARMRFKLFRWLYSGSAIIILSAAIVLSVNLLFHHQLVYNGNSTPEYNEAGQKRWARVDTVVAPQTFLVSASEDTVIETKGGIVLSVPAGCFLDKDGQPVTGEIEFVVKEALDASTIIKAGLSTMSGNKLLETGGMFFIDARKNGEPLKIDPKNSIYAQIPSDSLKAGMQAFHGERLSNGTINWIAPKPVEHFLVPRDIKTLNFYPPRYLDSLASWGYDITNKKLTDSLYYSLASLFEVPPASPALLSELPKMDTIKDIVPTKREAAVHGVWFEICAINPAKIKAIWNDKFQNTNLATKEFEERLNWIHQGAGMPELELYINNLDKPLYTIDSMAAALNTGMWRKKFLDFAARHDGRVVVNSRQIQKLKEYYRIKSKLFTEAAVKTERDFVKKKASLNEKANEKRNQHNADSTQRTDQNYKQEFDLNLNEARRQLGYNETNLGAVPKNTYNVQITQTGWCNIDRYVDESVSTRTTLDFTDKETGKKANIKYVPVSFKINRPNDYDNIALYLLPDKLNSFMKIEGSNGVYAEKLNELMKYNLLCIGYKKEQAFVYAENKIAQKDRQPIELSRSSDQQVTVAINKVAFNSQASGLTKETGYQKVEFLDQQRIKNNMNSDALKVRLIMLVFSCDITVLNNGYFGRSVPPASKPDQLHLK